MEKHHQCYQHPQRSTIIRGVKLTHERELEMSDQLISDDVSVTSSMATTTTTAITTAPTRSTRASSISTIDDDTNVVNEEVYFLLTNVPRKR